MTHDRGPQEGEKSNFTASLDLRAGGFELEAAGCDPGADNVALVVWLGLALEDCCCALEGVAAASGSLAACCFVEALGVRSRSFCSGTATVGTAFAAFAVALFFFGELELAVAAVDLGAGCFRMTWVGINTLADGESWCSGKRSGRGGQGSDCWSP